MTVSIPRESIEKLESTIRATADPTVATVAWACPLSGARPSTWVAGSWSGSATLHGSRYHATAVSPTIGATGSGAGIELAAGSRCDLYVRLTDATETVVRGVGVLILS